MPLERFTAILGSLPPGRHTVSLQGEGEPFAHPDIWEMATQVREAKHVPYTITNGSLIDAQRVAALFPAIGVSLDTLDNREAERIGRKRLGRVVDNLERLVAEMGGDRIVVHTVNMGQDLRALRSYLNDRGIRRHVIQPLQTKNDYRKCYPQWPVVDHGPPRITMCRYLAKPSMRFFNVDGVDLPCPFIKQISSYRSDKLLKDHFAEGGVPEACLGCREIGGDGQ